MSNAERRRSRFAGHAVPQGTLSRLTAIHLVPQGTLPPRGPSLAYRRFTLSSRGPSLAAQFTLSSRGPSLAAQFTLSSRGPSLAAQFTLSSRGPSLAAQFTLSRLRAIHLVNTSLYARRQHPSAFAPALLYLRPSLGSCCRRSRTRVPPIQRTVLSS